MAARITDEEWDKLSPENFETHSLLRAVDAMDELRIVLRLVREDGILVRDEPALAHERVLGNGIQQRTLVVQLAQIAERGQATMEVRNEARLERHAQAAVCIEHQAQHRGARALRSNDEERCALRWCGVKHGEAGQRVDLTHCGASL